MNRTDVQDGAANVDPMELRRTCAAFGTGVTVITARHGGSDYGMTANAFMSVSLDPPLIVVSVNRRARILGKIEAAGTYAVSVLAEQMEPVAMHFAGKPRQDLGNLFEDFGGLPVVRGAIGYFAARLHQTVLAGDHVMFIGAVEKIARREGRPLIFHDGAFGGLPWTKAQGAGAPWPPGNVHPREDAPELW